MELSLTPVQWVIGAILILSALGILLAKNPVHACLSFLLTLLSLAALYLQLSAQFIAMMQILVYAGAILVIFMFVIVLFQDAYQQIEEFKAQSSVPLIIAAAVLMPIIFIFLGGQLYHDSMTMGSDALVQLPKDFGTAQALGHALYLDFFFPFEAVILLFLVAIVGAFYIGRKV